jgi:hypothetical protein
VDPTLWSSMAEVILSYDPIKSWTVPIKPVLFQLFYTGREDIQKDVIGSQRNKKYVKKDN